MLATQVLDWYRHKNVAGLNQLIRSQPSPIDNWISMAIHIQTKDEKPLQIRFYSKSSFNTKQDNYHCYKYIDEIKLFLYLVIVFL